MRIPGSFRRWRTRIHLVSGEWFQVDGDTISNSVIGVLSRRASENVFDANITLGTEKVPCWIHDGPQRLPESKFLHVTILVTPFDLIDHLLLRRTIEATYEVHDSDFLPWSSEERRVAKIRVSLFGEQVVPVLK